MSDLWPELERGLREAIAMSKPTKYCNMCEVTFSVSFANGDDSSWTVDYCPYCGDDLSEQAYERDNYLEADDDDRYE